ncbi:MAG: ATP-binding cassette domain-containing protein [Acidimicrobiia bacterium]
MSVIVRCDNLIKIHRQGNLEVVALQGLDFEMQAGEFVAMVGRSGAGKSTLMTILGGMDSPSAGRAMVAGADLGSLSPRRMVRHYRRNVGFMWQDFTRNLIPYLRAHRNVELPMLLAGVSSKLRRKRVRALMEATGLSTKVYAHVDRLSGGEQQRLALCVGLALGPSLLLADEPTGELDTETSVAVYELLRTLCHDGGLSVLVVTHDVALATGADRVVRLEDGRILTERHRHGLDMLTVDRRGRVQLPREMLKAAGMTDRVAAEVTEEGILLRRNRYGP